MNAEDLRDQIDQLLREGMSVQAVMRKLGLSEKDRFTVQRRAADPYTYKSDEEFRRRQEREDHG